MPEALALALPKTPVRNVLQYIKVRVSVKNNE